MFELFQSDALPPPKLSFAFAHQLCFLRGQNVVGINRFPGLDDRETFFCPDVDRVSFAETQALADLFWDDNLSALPESAHGGHYVSFGSAASDIHAVRLSDSRHGSKRLCWTHACSVSSAPGLFQ
jgi:hypothetical protein